jgi:hypothetical protein
MISIEDLVALDEDLRAAGFEVSTQQQLAAQQVVRLLALADALPRDVADLAGTLGPIFCTSAVQQQRFPAVYAQWMRQRFRAAPGPAVAEAPTPQPAPRTPAPVWVAGALALVLAGIVAHQRSPPPVPVPTPTPPTTTPTPAPVTSLPPPALTPTAGVDDPELPSARLAGLDSRLAVPGPTPWERVHPRNALLVLAPLLACAAWQLLRLARRPVLRRLSSRAPSALREVHLPGGARTLLPSLPLRRTAQELRRRRLVASRELQVESTVAATLRKGGVFTPVVGSRVEPSHLALVDRASLSDHQARLADVVLGQLAGSDVQIDAYDFDRDARTCRPHPIATPGRAALRRGRAEAVALEELRVRWPDHRMLVFADAAACFDPFTGAAAPWVATLAEWPTAVVVTPRPPEAWGLREHRLQQSGLDLVPLSRGGMQALMGIASDAPPAAAGTPSTAERPLHEQTATRWLERDPPPAETVERLCDGLRTELGRDGFAWLAGCAAYPEVHWGITLRIGAAMIPDPAALERVLPRLARLVWFRKAYLPDWLREALLDRQDAASEARVRSALEALLASLVESGGDVPLRIAVGAPPGAGPWAGLRRLLRAPVRGRDVADASPPDSPLRDQVFLRFVGGRSSSRLDASAPERLLARLRRDGLHLVRSPLGGLLVAVLASTAIAAAWPPLRLDPYVRRDVAAAFLDDDTLAVATVAGLDAPGRPLGLHLVLWTQRDGRWTIAVPPKRTASSQRIGMVLAPGSEWPVAFSPGGRFLVWVRPYGGLSSWDVLADAVHRELPARAGVTPTSVAIDAHGRWVAAADDREIWATDLSSPETARTILKGEGPRKTLLFSGAPGAPDRSSDLLSVGSGASTMLTLLPGGQRQLVVADARELTADWRVDGQALALSSDGRVVATRTDGGLQLWSMREDGRYTPSTVNVRAAPVPAGAALSPNGRWLAAFSDTGEAWLRDVVNQVDVPAPTLGAAAVRFAAFSPSNRQLVLGGSPNGVDVWKMPRRATLEIPVVVHVLYADESQNVSDDVVASQLKVLNDDFNARNADLSTVPAPFRSSIGDAAITFSLAQRDPTGAASTGITRTRIPARFARGFELGGPLELYSASRGGADPWPTDRYLNLWVAPLARSIVGWAQPPGGDARTDGVALAPEVFGATGRLSAAFDRGRTATSEVALYLGVRHLWGDDGEACSGSDGVDDTPNQAGPNTGVPTFPHVSCGNGPDGDMFMNFTDHTDDSARTMFTNGQVAVMRRTLLGPRAGLSGRAAPVAPAPTPAPEVCYGPRTRDRTTTVKLGTGDFRNVGSAAQGPPAYVYEFKAPAGAIKSVAFRSCSGCDASGSPRVYHDGETWIATGDSVGPSGATRVYEIVYTTTEQVRVPCPAGGSPPPATAAEK